VASGEELKDVLRRYPTGVAVVTVEPSLSVPAGALAAQRELRRDHVTPAVVAARRLPIYRRRDALAARGASDGPIYR